jgi:hypothetical protein
MQIADWARAGLLLIGGAAPLAAQATLDLRGYYLNVALAVDSGPFNTRGLMDVQRARILAHPTLGAWSLDAAYEHTLVYTSAAGAAGTFGGLGQARSGTDWLPLQGSLGSSQHLQWRDRADRLSLRYATHALELAAGRQTISWATTLFLTPADPFAPFDPSEPFREYRTGVDAFRARAFPAPFLELDGVVRPAKTPLEKTLTAALRAKAATGHWEIGGWGGVVHDEPAASLSATRTVAGAVLRAEGVIRRSAGRTVTRLAVGADRSFNLAGRTLYVVAEYQRDGFGAARPEDLPGVLFSAPASRAELQVYGRDVTAGQVSYQVHPLVSLELLALWDLDDGSALLAPALSYSAGTNAAFRAGLFVGGGRTLLASGAPGSEYGAVPTVGYVGLTAFF